MKIEIICSESKKEDKYIKAFAEFYLSRYMPNIKEIDIDCPDKNVQQRAPDYFFIQPKVLVEVKEIHDKEELESTKAWGYNIRRLEKELESRTLEGIKGTYLVHTPQFLKIKRGSEKSVVDHIIEAVKKNLQVIEIKDVGRFEIRKISCEGNFIGFSTGSVKWVDPADIIHKNINRLLFKANGQLGIELENVKKKILLLVNNYPVGRFPDEFVEALVYSYDDLLSLENIDEIWLQYEVKTGKFSYTLIYTRDFLISFDKRRIDSNNEIHKQLFEKWFSPLMKIEDRFKENLFTALKNFLKDEAPHVLFPSNSLREDMVHLGEWLAKNDRFDDIIWIIDKFINDPDPCEPKGSCEPSHYDYHKQIEEGKDPIVIATVLGHLAWVIRWLAVRKEYITKALEYTERLLMHKNLYVKLQAVVPLIKIAFRRQWLNGWGNRPRVSEYKKFHELVFNLVELVRKNPNYKAIANQLCKVFAYYKDLSTKEAEQVLDALRITHESAWLFVYFAIFRKRHFQDQHIDFEKQKFEEKLKRILVNVDENYQQLRVRITWHLWKILSHNKKEFHVIKPYVEIVLQHRFEKGIYRYVEAIIEDCINKYPEICIQWYKQMLEKITKFVGEKDNLMEEGGLWLWRTEEIVEKIAKLSPEDLIEIIEKLMQLSMKGVVAGNWIRLFKSYKQVPESEKKVEIKKKFRQWYKFLKKLNSELEKIDWD